jgi:hypothetical protein
MTSSSSLRCIFIKSRSIKFMIFFVERHKNYSVDALRSASCFVDTESVAIRLSAPISIPLRLRSASPIPSHYLAVLRLVNTIFMSFVFIIYSFIYIRILWAFLFAPLSLPINSASYRHICMEEPNGKPCEDVTKKRKK